MQKTQIRRGCFETNSSSSHSLTISNSGRCYADLPIIKEFYDEKTETYWANCVVLTGGEYGWGVEHYTDSWEKANYLATHLLCYRQDDERQKEMFESVIKSETGADNIFYDFTESQAYIDHQSVGDADEAFESVDSLKNFLFNRASILIIDNDNH